MIGLFGKHLVGRFGLVLALFALMVAAVAWRIIDLHVFEQDFLQHQGDARSVRHIPSRRTAA